MQKNIKRIAVYCGSKTGVSEIYAQTARELGKELAKRNIELVYGAGRVGLMGILADAVLQNGGRVTGVVPRQFVGEVVHEGLTQTIYVDSMAERKLKMIALSDANIALPGGYGTFDEIGDALVLLQLGESLSPCGFLNVDSYYDHLEKFFNAAHTEKFLDDSTRSMAIFASSPEKMLDALENYTDTHNRAYWRRRV